MRKPTSFFVWTLSILVFLSLTFTACGSSTLPASAGPAALPAHSPVNQVYALAWSPDGMHLASGGQDQSAHVWNPTTGQQVGTYRSHYSRGEVLALAWSPDGQRLASGN